MSPEKAKPLEQWTASNWLESITAPMEGMDCHGEPPIPATNYVEGLWGFIVTAIGSYEEKYKN